MNKTRLVQYLSIALIFVLAACQRAEQSGGATMFKPGDTLNGMNLTTGAAEAPPLWAFCSNSDQSSHSNTFNCTVPLLPTLAIGHIFLLADEALAHQNWSDLNWELYINDQAVNLESFGRFEYMMPTMAKSPSPVREVFKKATAWNVVLTNLNPGKHTLRFQAENETESYTWFVNLTIESAEGTDISSIPFPPKS